MSSRRERIDQLISELESTSGFNERNQAIGLEEAKRIWERYLPDGITPEKVSELREYRKDYSCAFNTVYGRKAIGHAASDEDIAFLTAELETEDVFFGFGFARPVVNTRENLMGGLSHELTVDLHDFSGLNDTLADLWMDALSQDEEQDEEAEQEE